MHVVYLYIFIILYIINNDIHIYIINNLYLKLRHHYLVNNNLPLNNILYNRNIITIKLYIILIIYII